MDAAEFDFVCKQEKGSDDFLWSNHIDTYRYTFLLHQMFINLSIKVVNCSSTYEIKELIDYLCIFNYNRDCRQPNNILQTKNAISIKIHTLDSFQAATRKFWRAFCLSIFSQTILYGNHCCIFHSSITIQRCV